MTDNETEVKWETEPEDKPETEPEENPIRVMVVDDHELVRGGLTGVLDRQCVCEHWIKDHRSEEEQAQRAKEEGRDTKPAGCQITNCRCPLFRPAFTVVASAGSWNEGLEAARANRLDLALLDLFLPDGSGVDLCRIIKSEQPDAKIVMLTGAGVDDEAVQAAIMAGAAGYLLKPSETEDLVRALRTVARGESYLDPHVTSNILARLRETRPAADPAKLASLTNQERVIMERVAEGKTNKEIADELFLSDKTVKNYVSSILTKLGLERRAQVGALLSGRRS